MGRDHDKNNKRTPDCWRGKAVLGYVIVLLGCPHPRLIFSSDKREAQAAPGVSTGVLRRSSRQLQMKGLQKLSCCSVTGMGNKHGKENEHLTLPKVKLWSSWTFLPELLHKAGPAAANCQGLNHAYRACSRSQLTILLAPSATIQRLLTQNDTVLKPSETNFFLF